MAVILATWEAGIREDHGSRPAQVKKFTKTPT
jgi:hypothetical protein